MEKLLAGYQVVFSKSECLTIPKELTYNRTFKAKNTHHTHTFGYILKKEGSSFPVCFRSFTHTPTHGLTSTSRMRTAVFETWVRPFNDPTAIYAMLMNPSEGETAVHCCHCPGDMAVRMSEVLTRPWAGVHVPLVLVCLI